MRRLGSAVPAPFIGLPCSGFHQPCQGRQVTKLPPTAQAGKSSFHQHCQGFHQPCKAGSVMSWLPPTVPRRERQEAAVFLRCKRPSAFCQDPSDKADEARGAGAFAAGQATRISLRQTITAFGRNYNGASCNQSLAARTLPGPRLHRRPRQLPYTLKAEPLALADILADNLADIRHLNT